MNRHKLNDGLRDLLRWLGCEEPTEPGPEQDAYDDMIDDLTHVIADRVTVL